MGEQVANNKETQHKLEIRNVNGQLYITDTPHYNGLVLNSYRPMGNILIYPAKWGRITAIEYFIDCLIKDQEEIISDAKAYIEQLKNAKY